MILPKISSILHFTQIVPKNNNVYTNEIRENIIKFIPNITSNYLNCKLYGKKWLDLKTNFETSLKNEFQHINYSYYTIDKFGGRNYNFDFILHLLDENKRKIHREKLEFKFNAENVDELPQFVSPMNPSQFLSQSFECYYYDNYLVKIFDEFNIPIPNKDLYINTINNNKPKCIEKAQLLYYNGCKSSKLYTGDKRALKFYETCIEKSRECIYNFIGKTDLYVEKLSSYLLSSQQNKMYLLYKNKKFYIEKPKKDHYMIVDYYKNPQLYSYKLVTKSGKNLKALLRWKNGNGIAFPAFQISY